MPEDIHPPKQLLTNEDFMHNFRKAVLASLVAASIGAIALPATAELAEPFPTTTSATQVVDSDPSGEVHDRAASEAIDIAIIAKHKSWTLPDTRRHMGDQQKFGDLQEQIESQFPTEFSGAEFAKTPGGKSYLRFRGVVPDAAKSLAAESGLNVDLTGGREFSAEELKSRSVATVRYFADAGYKQVGSAVLADGRIEVVVTGQPKPGINLPQQLTKGVVVRYVNRDVVVNEHTYGGAYIHGANTQCTTGFSVRSLITDETGVSTAAHCSGMNHYHQPEGGPAYDTVWEDQHEGLNGDVEWHSTDHLELAEYYADPTDRREVNSVETSAAVNNIYCVYSRMQGTRSCDDVYSTFATSSTSGGGLVSNLVAMDGDNTVGGDSGGPWSYSTEAVGGHRGDQWIMFNTRNVWSRAWLFDSAIDVEVIVQ